ncbi:MAG: 50S ribosomal protein L29 [Deltaproteobacteria bacterium]|nr:MAG: 50S ribosomal protein L29 [Deltaproteobacteria bacterium]
MAETIKSMSDESLTHRLVEAERELVHRRFAHSQGALENTASLRELRKEIARIKTEAGRRESQQGLPRDAIFNKYRKTLGKSQPKAASEESKGGFLQGIVDKLTGNE